MPSLREPGNCAKSMETEIMGHGRDVGVQKACILLLKAVEHFGSVNYL